MSQNNVVVFVCEHGAAKSVIAAAYFNKLASEHSIDARAVARGTNPDEQYSANAIAGLYADPQKLLLTDIESAQQIVAFCELPDVYRSKTVIEQWDGVPPVSENYEKARDAIAERIHQLMKSILPNIKENLP